MLKIVFTITLIIFSNLSSAAPDAFSKGPVFKKYGENAVIENGLANPETQQFKVVFDISETSDLGQTNRNFNSVARFINMHVRAGVPLSNLKVAMVVHGKASFDLMNNAAYKTKFMQDNASEELLNALLRSGVEVYLCGQSAVFSDIDKDQVNSGVAMSLSAMTANALLQQRGFTLNPF